MEKEQLADQGGMEIGIYSLADLYKNPHTGKTVSAKERLDEIIAAVQLADEAGLDIFGVGEPQVGLCYIRSANYFSRIITNYQTNKINKCYNCIKHS